MEDLVTRAQRGDAAALAGLLDELLPYASRICAGVALDEAEDATQETMIAVLKNISGLRAPAALHGWVRTIAVREAIRAARRGRSAGLATDPADIAHVPDVGDLTTAVEVREVLAALSPEQRAILVLRHVDGLSDREISASLSVPAGTVKSRLFRARAAFKDRWSA